jgi:hypothetical protein
MSCVRNDKLCENIESQDVSRYLQVRIMMNCVVSLLNPSVEAQVES